MRPEPTIDSVSRLFIAGADAVSRITSDFDEQSWELAVCGHWTSTQTACHLLAVARWYHAWLDRAIEGETSPPFAVAEMDKQNEDALATIRDMPGEEAVAEFVATASSYLERATDHWNLAYGYPRGTVTVGLHCGIAATEWHLHAWDLSTAAQARHHPQEPGLLFAAAGACLARATGGLQGTILRGLVPIGARRDPWTTMLKKSGRTPTESN